MPNAECRMLYPRLFQSAADYYARYRPPYGAALIQKLVALAPQPLTTAYDLGCGTGGLALPLSRYVPKVYAIDPEPAMIDKARAQATAANIQNITFWQGPAEALPAALPPPQLVTMGQCFHWMDRAFVLDLLAARMADQSVVVILTGNPLGLVEEDENLSAPPAWHGALCETLVQYTGTSKFQEPPRWLSHEKVAAAAKGWSVTAAYHRETYQRTADEIIGLCLSLSWCSPEKLGTRKEAFETELRARLLTAQPDNVFREQSGRRLLILRRHLL